ncbi:hypothetical protein G9H71_17645 [Motilibacter sp. E257]|uniref:Very-short-patch-repair endonuclease n=1 Tax=Motilibacter deserti TaxID=2714956 RepID=A0ABX0GYE6_9ACTN|nr:hypothetical protein [Motilibacter deserti]
MARTSLTRTVLDVARVLPLEHAVVVADAPLAARGTSVQALASAADAMRRWPGIASARRVLQLADGRAESAGESLARVLLIALGYGHVEPQAHLRGSSGQRYRVDLLVDGLVVVEFDGRVKYADPHLLRGREPADVLRAEKRREQDLEDAGWQVVRLEWRDLFDPEAVRRKVDAALARARRARAS